MPDDRRRRPPQAGKGAPKPGAPKPRSAQSARPKPRAAGAPKPRPAGAAPRPRPAAAGPKPRPVPTKGGPQPRKSGAVRPAGTRPAKQRPSERTSARAAPGKKRPGTVRSAKPSTAKRAIDKPITVRKPKTVNKPKTTKGAVDKGEAKSSESTRRRASGKKETNQVKVKMGMALKFTLPVGILVFLVISTFGYLTYRQSRRTLINEMMKDGASCVMMMVDKARNVIAANNQADQGTNLRWPVDLRLITASEYESLGGYKEDQVPSKVIIQGWREERKNSKAAADNLNAHKLRMRKIKEEGRLLRRFVSYLKSDGKSVIRNEILDAYIFTGGAAGAKKFVAGSSAFTGKMEIAPGDWLSKFDDLSYISLGDRRVTVKGIDIKISGDTINIDGKDTKVLNFKAPVHGLSSGKRVRLGSVNLALSADIIEVELGSLQKLILLIGIISIVLAVGTCVLIAAKITAPVQTLIEDMEMVAEGDLRHKTRAHSTDEIGLIANEFNRMTQHLLTAQAREKEAQRLENELSIASEIQMKLLPPNVPSVKGYDISATYHPAKEVGGDYYDFLPISGEKGQERLGIIVADVSGKGIPGSMVMTTTRTVLHFVALGNLSAADTLTRTNAIVAADIKRGMFVTAFYLVVDVRARKMLCASAGHNPMLILRADGTLDEVNPNGIALGFDKGRIFQRTIKEEEVQLQSGDRVVLYTDGVVEAMNINNEEYSDERFNEFVKKNDDLTSEEFINELLADLERHKGKADQHDDITIVTFRVL